MRSGKWWPWIVAAIPAAAVVAVLIFAYAVMAAATTPPTAWEILSGSAAVIALGSLAWRSFQWAAKKTHDPPAMSDGERLAEAKRLLAMEVKKQRTEEARYQGWEEPPLIPVRWRTPEDPRVPSHTDAVKNPPRTAASHEIAELAEKFRACEPRRLVILGGKGTGKTTLAALLVLELLETRKGREDEPVPVIIPVEQWDTEKYPKLQEWLAEQLYQEHPCLRWFGVDGVRTMVDLHEVLPILDGLDELPEAAQTTVIERLNASLDSRDQLILTCRTVEYTDAVGAGRAAKAAAVLEPLEVIPDMAAEYLKGSLQSHQRGRPAWARVLEVLRTEPGSVLAEVTKTPLGLWLLRTVYVEGDGDPDELTDPARFSGADKLQAHLLGHLIAALLPPDGDKGRAKALGLSRTYQADDVERWLGFLAHHLSSQPSQHDPNRHGTRDFEWWRLAATTGRKPSPDVFAPMSGLVCGFASWLVGGLAIGLGSWTALLLGLFVGLMVRFVFGPEAARSAEDPPGVVDLRTSRRRHALASRLVAWSAVGLVFGLALGPVSRLAFDQVRGPAPGLMVGLTLGLAMGITDWFDMPSHAPEVNSPQVSLQSDRTLNLIRIVCGCLASESLAVVWFMVGGAVGIAATLAFGLVLGPMVGLAAGRHRAWLAYVWATWRLSREGVLPRKLMPFLVDMHRLGLLRAVGRIYQFRHAELQDHLAEAYQGAD